MLSRLIKSRERLKNSKQGALSIELGLMVGVIVLVIIVAITAIRTILSSWF